MKNRDLLIRGFSHFIRNKRKGTKTLQNLKDEVKGETHEYTIWYLDYEEIAREEVIKGVTILFN